ncbi:DUF4252 domain-containing protein [Bacteroides sp. OttesenSCG-928-J23]|nr:DUF4252 domain-containing protein [Bacteroides sp. OttesenSCG-928-J23]
MKKILVLIVGLFLWNSAGAQEIVSDFQKKYEKDSEFTIVNITSKMFQLIGAMASNEEMSIIKDLDGLRVLSTDTKTGKHYKNAMSMLNASKYEELMSVEEGKEKVKMFTREKNGTITSLVILTEDGGEFSMIGISGNIDLKRVASLSKTLNIEKLEKLEEVSVSEK